MNVITNKQLAKDILSHFPDKKALIINTNYTTDEPTMNPLQVHP